MFFEEVRECRICDCPSLHPVLDLGEQPPANALCDQGGYPPPDVPLRLMYCENCCTSQIGHDVKPEYLFSRYLWVTGTSKLAMSYCHQFVEEILDRFSGNRPQILEIASNDGTFLNQFKMRGCSVLGVDPAVNLAAAASRLGVTTLPLFFSRTVASDLLEERGPFDIVLARNVIPHVKAIHSVVDGICTVLSDLGMGIIEFHDSALIQKELQYDYIYHEHLCYFSLSSMIYLLSRHQLKVFDIMRSPISGGSWVIFFSKTLDQKSVTLKRAEASEAASGLNNLYEWKKFSTKAIAHREQLKKVVQKIPGKLLAYGASARSSTLLNFCGLDHQKISAIVDKNPLKHNLLTPGTRIPIISLEEHLEEIKQADHLLLLAWNFREEVIDELAQIGFRGKVIVPLPNSVEIL